MTRRRDPFPLSEALSEFTAAARPAGPLADVQTAWPICAGETISKWATPVSERAGVVTFECSDAVVAHELEMMKPQLLEKLAAELPGGAPQDLRFKVR